MCRNSAAPEMAARTTAAPPTASSPTSRMCTATFTSNVPYPMWTCQHKAREGTTAVAGQSRALSITQGGVGSRGLPPQEHECLRKGSTTSISDSRARLASTHG